MRDSAAAYQRDFDVLVRRLGGLQDVVLRAGAARLTLMELTAERMVALVNDALDAVLEGSSNGQDALAALGAALEQPEWDGLRARAGLIAHVQAPRTAMYLTPRDEGSPDDPVPRVPDFGAGRPLTLGERKAVARGRNPEIIARVLRDPDPAVIGILLGNPSLVEAQVVRLAARRPVTPAVLREVWRSPRWSTRHAVRLALTQNPWCPLDISVRVVPLLTVRERMSVAQSAELPAALRAFAAELVRPLAAL